MVYAGQANCRLPISAGHRLIILESLQPAYENMQAASGLIIVVDTRIVDRLGFGSLAQEAGVSSEKMVHGKTLRHGKRI
jgi:hypothetical protein